jgi:hypothetical protein
VEEVVVHHDGSTAAAAARGSEGRIFQDPKNFAWRRVKIVGCHSRNHKGEKSRFFAEAQWLREAAESAQRTPINARYSCTLYCQAYHFSSVFIRSVIL